MPRARGLVSLNVHGVFQPRREDIVVIGRAGDAGHHEFGQREAGCKAEGFRIQARPDWIEGLSAKETVPC